MGGVIKRFSQLIIPSAVAMALHLLLLSALSNDISIFSNPQAWRTELFSTLWFLKSLFICYVIYMAIIVVPKPYRYFLIFLVILVTPFIKYFRILYMFPCFILGVISHKHDYIIKYNTIVQIISAPIFILCLAFWNSGAFTLNLVSFHGLLSGEITPLLIFFKQYSYVLLTGISGALFFTSFLFRCFSRYEKSTILCKLSDYGTYTLGIYIIQTFLLETVLSAYVKFDLYFSPIICNVFIIPFASLIILCVSILLVKLINRNKLLSSLLIGSNK